MILRSISKNSLLLGGFAIATTAVVALVNHLTAPYIQSETEKALKRSLNQVLPSSEYTNQPVFDCVKVTNQALGPGVHTVYRARTQANTVALILESTSTQGYSGNIRLLASIYRDGQIGAVRVTQHKETPGLGDKVEPAKSDWIHSFNGEYVDADFAVTKDGGRFDAFTGATITPRAVVNQVKHTVAYAMDNFDNLSSAPSDCEVAND